MSRKLYQRRGESFIETIAAMLIISLGMLMLAGSILSAARVNKRASNETIQVVLPNPSEHPERFFSETKTINIAEIDDSGNTGTPVPINVTLYKAVPEGGEGDGKQVLYYYALDP